MTDPPKIGARNAPWDGSPRRTLVTFLATVAAVGFTLDDLLWGDRVPAYRDLLFFILPFENFLADHIRRLELPLWNPFVFMGTPFLANYQSAVFYPPSLLLALPFPIGFDLMLLANYLIALSGMWVFLRSRGLQPTACAIGSMVFTLGGYLISVMNVTAHLQGAVWAPWLLFCWGRLLRRRSGGRFAAFVAVSTVQLFSGSIEHTLFTLALVGCWTLARETGERRHLLPSALLFAAAYSLALMLAMIQIVPTFEYVAHSGRSGPLSFQEVTAWSLEPVSLLQWLLPHSSALLPPEAAGSLGPAFEGHLPLLQSIYLGLVPLVLAIGALGGSRERWLWGGLAVAGVVLSLGNLTPLFKVLYQWLPIPFARLRYPEKFLFVTHFAVAVLAADGAEQLFRRRRSTERVVTAAIATLVALGVALLVLRFFSFEGIYLRCISILSGKYLPPATFTTLGLDVAAKAQRLVLLLSALGLLLVLRGRSLGDGTFQVLLLALTAVDLASTHRHLNLTFDANLLTQGPFLVPPKVLHETGLRVFSYQTSSARGLEQWLHFVNASEDLPKVYRALNVTYYANRGMLFGVANASGADGIQRASDALLLSTLASSPREQAIRLLRICSVGFLIGPDPLDVPGVGFVRASDDGLYRAYRVESPVARARLVERLRPVIADRDALEALTEPNFDAAHEAIVPELPPEWTDHAASSTETPQVEIVLDEDRLLRLRVNSSAGGFLVLNDSFFPGWEATRNGEPLSIYRTNVFFRGIAVPAGKHLVEFRYRPASFRIGAGLSFIGVVLVFGVVAIMPRESSQK